jgi:hypothetical protein
MLLSGRDARRGSAFRVIPYFAIAAATGAFFFSAFGLRLLFEERRHRDYRPDLPGPSTARTALATGMAFFDAPDAPAPTASRSADGSAAGRCAAAPTGWS